MAPLYSSPDERPAGNIPGGAVVLNATIVTPDATGSLVIFPSGAAQPPVSDLNYGSGDVRANLQVVPLGSLGRVRIFTSARLDIVLDVAGWFS